MERNYYTHFKIEVNVTLKRQYLLTNLHGVITQKLVFIVTAMKPSKPIRVIIIYNLAA
jgi:hypothetical protein